MPLATPVFETVVDNGVTLDLSHGLSETEVAARRALGHGNSAELRTGRTYAQILRDNVFTFINFVLFGLGVALVLLGRWSDALVSVGVVSVNLLVGVIQEVRAKRMLDRIALLTRPTASVIRDGVERTLSPSELVRGDVVRLRSGDQVVVDGVVIGAGRMDMDESLLTGESDLVPKGIGDLVYSGSFCVNGTALYQATRIGSESVANQLTAGARAFRRVYTPLQQEINRAVQMILVVAVLMELLLVLAALVQQMPLVQSVQISVVIAGLVPNGLFLAIGVAYAMGAVRIASRGALVQQANAIESLSNVDVLCLDKTGTLTTNRIRLHALHPIGIQEAELRRLLGDFAASTPAGNRTSDAIGEECIGQPRRTIAEVPFSSARKWSALLIDDEFATRGTYVLGAPDVLAPYVRHDERSRDVVAGWTERGLRVVVFAYRADAAPLHDRDGQPRPPDNLVPLGLIALSDELRPDAHATLGGFAAAGVGLKIISGDGPGTVLALAAQAGLPADARAVSGLHLDALDDAQLGDLAEDTMIFGRITPQQKERLVRVLRGRGHYVAMIGDGVNDVLSLKQANLGIAMHGGSQAARGVADLILLNDSFAVLPDAFREGQRIVSGMRDILKLFVSRVLYVALLIGTLAVVQAGFPLAPKHSALLSLFVVGLPTLALAAWARPVAAPSASLLGLVLRFAVPAAVTMAVAGVGVYLAHFLAIRAAGLSAGLDLATASDTAHIVARSALTGMSVLCGLLLVVFVEPPSRAWTGGDVLSGDRRPALLACGLLGAFVAVLTVPPLREFFDLVALDAAQYAVLAAVAVAWAFVVRWAWRARFLERLLVHGTALL